MLILVLSLSVHAVAQKQDSDDPDLIRIEINGNDASITKGSLLYTSLSASDRFKKIVVKIPEKRKMKVYFLKKDLDKIDSLDFSDTNIGNKVLAGLINTCKCNEMHLRFSDDTKFLIDNKRQDELVLKITTQDEIKNNFFDSNFTFIPSVFSGSVGDWPNYISSKNENIKYRFAIDFSKSFSQASSWEFKYKKDGNSFYRMKDVIRPKYLKYISLSIKNYYPLFDSITYSTSFNALNLEAKAIFENYQNKLITSFIPDSAKPVITTDTAHMVSGTIIDTTIIIKVLQKLNNDLLSYSNYLNKNIINKDIWLNDIQYINSRLNTRFDLTNYSVNGLNEKLLEFSKSIKNKFILELIGNILSSYAHILSYSIMSTPPVQIKDMDMLTYNLNFYKGGKKINSQDYCFLIRGGFKIDFSTGFAYSSLKNENYQIINAGTRKDTTFYNNTDSITNISSTNLKSIGLLSEEFNIGVTALLHFYRRTGTLFNYGGTFGFMLNTKPEINYLLGFSLLFGQKQRLILSGGTTLGQVSQLNPKYDKSKTYTESELDQISDSQLTTIKWGIGYFFSLNYNLGNLR